MAKQVHTGYIYQINDRGEILGWSDTTGPDWLLQNQSPVELSERVGGGWSDIYPYRLNNLGALLAAAKSATDQQYHTVLLLPVEITFER